MSRLYKERQPSAGIRQSLTWKNHKLVRLEAEMNITEAEIALLQGMLIAAEEKEAQADTSAKTIYVIREAK